MTKVVTNGVCHKNQYIHETGTVVNNGNEKLGEFSTILVHYWLKERCLGKCKNM